MKKICWNTSSAMTITRAQNKVQQKF